MWNLSHTMGTREHMDQVVQNCVITCIDYLSVTRGKDNFLMLIKKFLDLKIPCSQRLWHVLIIKDFLRLRVLARHILAVPTLRNY